MEGNSYTTGSPTLLFQFFETQSHLPRMVSNLLHRMPLTFWSCHQPSSTGIRGMCRQMWFMWGWRSKPRFWTGQGMLQLLSSSLGSNFRNLKNKISVHSFSLKFLSSNKRCLRGLILRKMGCPRYYSFSRVGHCLVRAVIMKGSSGKWTFLGDLPDFL